MKMTLLDKSECFRAFLLLIGEDRRVTDKERAFLLDTGKRLDFERRFCETSISDLLENTYINMEPPVFSNTLFVKAFLRDAIRVALIDDDFQSGEFRWLASIAKRNGLEEGWVEKEVIKLHGSPLHDRSHLELEKYV